MRTTLTYCIQDPCSFSRWFHRQLCEPACLPCYGSNLSSSRSIDSMTWLLSMSLKLDTLFGMVLKGNATNGTLGLGTQSQNQPQGGKTPSPHRKNLLFQVNSNGQVSFLQLQPLSQVLGPLPQRPLVHWACPGPASCIERYVQLASTGLWFLSLEFAQVSNIGGTFVLQRNQCVSQ